MDICRLDMDWVHPWVGSGRVGSGWMETSVRNICRDGQVLDPAIRIRPDFCYAVKSGYGRISYLTLDRIFSISCAWVSFYPRDALYIAVFAVETCLCVCLSVCLSVRHTPVLYLNGERFRSSGSPSFYFFDPLRRYPIPREPRQRGIEYTGVWKVCDFPLKSQSISETMRDRPMVTTER